MTKIIKPIPYAKGVAEAKRIVASIAKNMWRLAEITAKLEPKYGDKTLERFAKDVGLTLRTLRKYRQTYLRFGSSKGGCAPHFSILEKLVSVPDAEKIIERHPKLTYRQAKEIARRPREFPPLPPLPPANNPKRTPARDAQLTIMHLTSVLDECCGLIENYAGDIEPEYLDELVAALERFNTVMRKLSRRRFRVIEGGK